MKIKPFLYKSEGMGIAIWFGKRYFAIWFHWADGTQILANNKEKILWRSPYFRIVNQYLND